MRFTLRSMLTGAIFVGGAAMLAVPAVAEDGQVHVLTLQLPGGGVEHIQYTGDVAPHVVLMPAPRMVAVPSAAVDPIATLERLSALIDQQAAAMLRQVEALQGDMLLGSSPGASGYSFVSTMSGKGMCTRSVRITFNGSNAPPRMVPSTSGDCGPDQRQQAPADVAVPAPPGRTGAAPGTIEVKATGQGPDGGTVRQVAWAR